MSLGSDTVISFKIIFFKFEGMIFVLPLGTNTTKAMKQLIFILGAFLLFSSLSAQETTKNKLTKEQKAAKLEAQYQSTLQLVDSRKFVLEAEYFTGSSPFDFILIDSLNAVLQEGRGGGLKAVSGNVTTWKVTKNEKKKRVSIHVGIRTIGSVYTVFMEIDAAGHTIANFSSNVSLTGYITSISEGTMYKTTPL
jgi:hypothetical protein